MRLIALLAVLVYSIRLTAQHSASEILHKISGLNTAASVLYIAAHPDDENTRLLSYLAKERHFRTAYLSLTHGEGGQNLIGNEQSTALGIVRSQELLAARRIDGALQFFSRAADFGYSKSPDETFQNWDRDSVLSDVVLVVRKLKPDVIICRFPTTGEGGHGHHTASAILAAQAFSTAADNSSFPETAAQYSTWKTRRLYWNTFNFGGNSTIGPGQFTLDVGGYNPLLGKSYGEIAAASRSMHKSQGFGSMAQRGNSLEYFRLLQGDSSGTDPFSGIDIRLARFSEFKTVSKMIADCEKTFDAARPYRSLEQLARIHEAFNKVQSKNPEAAHWKKIKLKETEQLMMACAGLWLHAQSPGSDVLPGSSITLSLQAINRSPLKVEIMPQGHGSYTELSTQILQTFTLQITAPGKTAIKSTGFNPAFNHSDYAGTQTTEPVLELTASLRIANTTFTVKLQAAHRRQDPVKGEIITPVHLIPPAEVFFSEKVYLSKPGENKRIRIIVRAHSDSVSGIVRVHGDFEIVNKNWDSTFFLQQKGAEHHTDLLIKSKNSNTYLKASALVKHEEYPWRITPINYDHIPSQVMLSDATAKFIQPDLKTGVKRIGYIPGAGDEVVQSLKEAGYEVSVIDPDKVNREILRGYEAIVTGVRAFNVHEELHSKMPALLDFVNEGGNLIVQYNTNSRVGPLSFTPGPYPFTITRDRVTDEKSPVRFREPGHPALNHPNKIQPGDFEGWIQERGIYFAGKADPKYKQPLAFNDPGEDEKTGSLLIAPYGKGNFVYTGIAFFRQLPAGVPGAYRLFANLLSLPANEK